jgi:hypothetical protein
VFFGLRRRNYAVAVVEGFTVVALGTWGAYWVRSVLGPNYNTLAMYTPPVAYILAVFLWFDAFLRQPQPEWFARFNPQRMLEEVRQYTEVLKAFRQRPK